MKQETFLHTKKLTLKLLLFAATALPVLYGLNYAVDNGLKRSHNQLFQEWNDIYSAKINADVLVLGSSRAWVHISPEILDSTLGVNSYNIGIDGYPFEMQYARFKIYLQHNAPPKYLIHSVDFTTFQAIKGFYQPEQFLPYINDTILQNLSDRLEAGFTLPERYFPMFKYNNHGDLVKLGINRFFNLEAEPPPFKYKGYAAIGRSWDNAFDKFKKTNAEGAEMGIDKNVRQEYEAFIRYCNNNNINLIFVFTPQYHEALSYIRNKDEILGIFREYSEKYNIPYLNYLNDSISYDKSKFYNSMHLNSTGSTEFSQTLAQDLRHLMSPGGLKMTTYNQ